MITLNKLNIWLSTAKKSKCRAEKFLISSAECSVGCDYIWVATSTTGSGIYLITGQQLVRATKNAMNTVRGCMDVENKLDTFLKLPSSYDEARAKTILSEKRVRVVSTNNQAFVALWFPDAEKPYLLRGEDVFAAVANATKQ